MATAEASTSAAAAVAGAVGPSKRPKPAGFVDSFWSPDYAGGLGILFQKLQQGVVENQQLLTIATLRAEAEAAYAERLGNIAPTVDQMKGGFARDDGASVRKAYEGVRGEMVEAAKAHAKIASSIRELVVRPFSQWCDAHALRVQNSQDDLQSKTKAMDRQAEAVKKLRSHYFNKCRLVEDLEEESKLAFKDPDTNAPESAKTPSSPPPKILGDQTFTRDQLKSMLTDALNTVPLGEFRVPILGVYQNVSAGTDIVDWLQRKMGASTVGYAEKIGQDLVDRGILRLVGNVGSTFANSSRMRYQWKTRAFQITGIPEKKPRLGRVGSGASESGSLDSPVVSNIAETLQAWNPLNNPYPNETPAERLRREAKEADEKYKVGVKRLDLLRCNLEESMMDHFKFLERCEADRLKAIKSVILDFSGSISNSIPSFQSQVDNMMLYQETIQPLGDLRYLLENYRTGAFVPRVTPYENYYGSVDDQIFGVELEARARADRKRVPVIVTTILTFLDNHYPDLEGDDLRRSIWLVDVPLAATHHLRSQINHGGPIQREILERYEIPIVASVLKLYLLELPDSLVSSQVYEIIKTIYNTTSDATNPIASAAVDSTPRIKVLQSTLGQLRLNNIATLDAITTHFTRLIDLTSADEEYVAALAHSLAPCILRPRTENTLTLEDRHSYRLVRDLFDYKEAIFGELKRQSSTLAAGSIRQRAVSNTDESHRKANMEARARAINDARRDRSPAPSSRHRRDLSSGPSGRFPVVVSPRQDNRSASGSNKRASLDVPGAEHSSPTSTRTEDRAMQQPPHTMPITISPPVTASGDKAEPGSDAIPVVSRTFTGGGPAPHIPYIPPPREDSPVSEPSPPLSSAAKEIADFDKTVEANGRTAVPSSSSSLRRDRVSVLSRGSSLKETDLAFAPVPPRSSSHHPVGVQLVDAPMDDD
ncbi:hypothetical protein DV737_g5058, partial [Chaetothyriales sp. CBS 132003]